MKIRAKINNQDFEANGKPLLEKNKVKEFLGVEGNDIEIEVTYDTPSPLEFSSYMEMVMSFRNNKLRYRITDDSKKENDKKLIYDGLLELVKELAVTEQREWSGEWTAVYMKVTVI